MEVRLRRMLSAVLLAFVLVVAAAIGIGSRRQLRAGIGRTARLIQAATSVRPDLITDLDSLPEPVSRYLRMAVPPTASQRLVRMSQMGTLRTDVSSDRWMPFEAQQLVAPYAIGFLWNARVTLAPLLHVRVRDGFIDGEGSGQVSLFSAFTVSSDAGSPHINSGALHRFLAEAVWYPTALLPSSKLQWSGIDATRAVASLTEHGVSVSLEFRFAETGEVTGIYTPARWGIFSNGYEQRPWEGHFRNYEQRAGAWIPREGEVGWYVDDQWCSVWKGTVVAFDTE
jgi:hypothetical protein